LPAARRPGEACIRVLLAGICNTDIEMLKGYASFRGVPGHEFVGRVEECPDARWIGRRVVGEINCGCGDCLDCHAGDSRHCSRRTTLGIAGRDGAFAEYLALPVENLQEVPEGISDQLAVFTEPLAAAYQVLEQVPVTDQMRVAVLGDGKLGLLIVRILSTLGCDLVLIGRHPHKLRHATAWGVETRLAHESDSVSIPPSLTGGYDVVVEATGSARGLAQALNLVRARGTVILKSTVQDRTAIDATRVVVNEIRIVGSRCGRFGPALAGLFEHQHAILPLLSDEFRLESGLEAFDRAQQPGILKVLLRP
ncbi:MAG: alcohol dehydrogenase catalytic domain-containing protein, partial [Acidobacteria bacterium]|nr:alcohol dehydrogenase catalytic domain-containing protein [Acidobacteriota bacterium]